MCFWTHGTKVLQRLKSNENSNFHFFFWVRLLWFSWFGYLIPFIILVNVKIAMHFRANKSKLHKIHFGTLVIKSQETQQLFEMISWNAHLKKWIKRRFVIPEATLCRNCGTSTHRNSEHIQTKETRVSWSLWSFMANHWFGRFFRRNKNCIPAYRKAAHHILYDI